MCMCVCECVCLCVCMGLCMYVYVYACMYVCVSIGVCVKEVIVMLKHEMSNRLKGALGSTHVNIRCKLGKI